MKSFHDGLKKNVFENNQAGSLDFFREAIKLDPGFALAHFELCSALFVLNKVPESKAAIEKAMQYKEALSERQQLDIKYVYQSYNSMDKALALADMWRQLYPADFKPYSKLMFIYRQMGKIHDAVAVGEQALENGHTGQLLITMARLEILQGNTDKALEYYERFGKEFPSKAQEISGVGDIYLAQGKFEKAQAHFEKLRLMNPDDLGIILKQSNTASKLGNFDQAKTYHQEAMSIAKTTSDSVQVIATQEGFLEMLGRPREAIALMEKRFELSEKIMPAFQARSQLYHNYTVQRYLDADLRKEYEVKAEEYLVKYDNSFINFRCIVYFNLYAFAEEAENFKQIMEECRDNLEKVIGKKSMVSFDAYGARLEKDYPKAIQLFEQVRDSSGVQSSLLSFFGELYRLNGELDKSRDFLIDYLEKNPNDAKQHYQLGLTYEALGEKQKAIKELESALEIWKDAEPEYIPANQAREKLRTLQS